MPHQYEARPDGKSRARQNFDLRNLTSPVRTTQLVSSKWRKVTFTMRLSVALIVDVICDGCPDLKMSNAKD
jgi:hypothetical protein